MERLGHIPGTLSAIVVNLSPMSSLDFSHAALSQILNPGPTPRTHTSLVTPAYSLRVWGITILPCRSGSTSMAPTGSTWRTREIPFVILGKRHDPFKHARPLLRGIDRHALVSAAGDHETRTQHLPVLRWKSDPAFLVYRVEVFSHKPACDVHHSPQ